MLGMGETGAGRVMLGGQSKPGVGTTCAREDGALPSVSSASQPRHAARRQQPQSSSFCRTVAQKAHLAKGMPRPRGQAGMMT